MRPRPNSISVMPLMLMTACGITMVDMMFLKVKPTLIRLKAIMPSCDTIWHVWQDRRDVSRAVHMPWNVLCVCSYSVTTGDNCTSNFILPIRLTSRISLTHYFSHSLKKLPIDETNK